ncbi:B12-binding domain-containing radical SAM protein [Burkholderia diffusa]|uniref:B12-binding domain-containing radical SAM protein n=1 Tax=Burkholderia diffusa TaxID=488732 RepID=UPI00157B2557|nr:radical SAM protein [Burkholderia diffusa]NTY37432.1 radical SAM protein [Burkholderia diffusa]
MKILCLIPPQVPSYFNAGHHLPVFMTGAFLRERLNNAEVKCVDGGSLNLTWRALGEILVPGFDLVILVNDFDGIDTFERTIAYVRELSPSARIMTVGRLSSRLPGYFERFDLDAIHAGGDPEAAALAYASSMGADRTVNGVAVRRPDGTYSAPGTGIALPAEEWVLPDVAEIPHETYSRLYLDDLHKFCGIPDRLELVVPVARGCPVGCAFCDVPTLQGTSERRLSVTRTLTYIRDAFSRKPFEYVSFYAPTFTLKASWLQELCEKMIDEGSPWPWKCVTTLRHLDRDRVALMARAGCVRISIGLESLEPAASRGLPVLKQTQQAEFDRLAAWCREAGVELNCFVILGLPGDSLAGVRTTVDAVRDAGARLRTSIYTPYHLMTADMSGEAAARYNRQLFVDAHPDGDARAAYYQLFFGRDTMPTRVMDAIPRKQEAYGD